jgi:hypothetical protein
MEFQHRFGDGGNDDTVGGGSIFKDSAPQGLVALLYVITAMI